MNATPFIANYDEAYIREDILKNPMQFLKKKLHGSKHNFGVDNITKHGEYREMGFSYNFRQYLHKYLYKQYGDWEEIYALNKTNVRKLITGKIDKIIDIE